MLYRKICLLCRGRELLMLPEIEHYRHRKPSYIKHLFLNRYLEAAAYKLLQPSSTKPIFNFVDAFAGPWRVSDDHKFSDASFSQAITTLETVRQTLSKMGRTDIKIRYRFCERSPESAARLRQFASDQHEFDIKIFQGLFEDNLDQIRSSCPNGFTFTFIDPTGWNIESDKVFRFLRALGGEFLFNFMAEGINRHAAWDGVAESVGRFLADPSWKEEFYNLPDSLNNESKILFLLKRKMRESHVATYLPEIVIRRPRDNRIKMRLLLGTHSARGVEVFRDVQEKVEEAAVLMRYKDNIERTGQPFLFPDDHLAELQAKTEGVGCPAYLESAAEVLLRSVLSQPGNGFEELAGVVMEEVPVRRTHLNKLSMQLRKERRLRFDLPPRKRTPTPATAIWPS